MSVLEVQGLRASYSQRQGRREVVHGVDFAVGESEVVALVGESGSGKSTTAHAVIGLLPEGGRVEGGSILLGDVDISGWSQKRLRAVRGRQVGLVPQDPVSSLDPVRPIGIQVGEILRLHGVRDAAARRRRVLDLLDRVGLDDPGLRARQYPHELSGGMRQRVLIATAIALRPRLIIADEPTSALDATVQRRILDLIDELRREEGTAVLLVTHDLGVAADRAHRVVVLNDGLVVEQGEGSDILSSPADPYTRQLLADAPALGDVAFRRPSAPLFLRDAAAAAGENPYAIHAEGLVKEFGAAGRRGQAFRAVDGVSFSVRRGTTHALVGESGSGKTTTARLVTRFLRPDAGRIELDGTDIAGLDKTTCGSCGDGCSWCTRTPSRRWTRARASRRSWPSRSTTSGRERGRSGGRASRSSSPASPCRPRSSSARRGSCREGSANASPSPAPSRSAPTSWCSTKPCRHSTSRCRRASSSCSSRSSRNSS